ncbi:MAG: glycoside hydrolase family 38 C-terminal domain-containing protein [Eubacteriales bacterium]|nr:glycoside hydrolase family 38 C-terminal domain-containing protein [Eubacteriales bacterium]
MNLFARFEQLKKQVAGNREKLHFEHTYEPDVAERNHITSLRPAARRILSEVNFALQLSAANDGRYDGEIDAAMAVLEGCVVQEETITRQAALEAESRLSSLQAAAKEYEVLYVAHAHIDMNWMWGWQETVAVTLSTFRTMLNLMREYPGFTYAQSQASVYHIVEEYDPDMMAEIQQRIREGRWEVTANAWVETDKNMPDTESLLRHIQETRDYLHKVWGIAPGSVKVDFSPDTFGHSRFVPEIDTLGAVPYYYHCRGLQDDVTLYRFRAPSGSEVLMYKEPYWYNGGINPDNGTGAVEMARRCGGLKTSLIVYGAGNHGGGPTRRDIEMLLEMQQWPIFPTLRFGTIHEYFQKAEAVREKLPVIDHELNAIFTGCYSTQSRIKLANRRAEAALTDAGRMSVLSHFVLGTAFRRDVFSSAWRDVLFTHFHDILTGSCVQESREYAMGLLAKSIAHAQSEQSKAYQALSQAVDTSAFPCDDCIARTRSEGAGVGFGIASYAGVPNPERGAGKTRVYTVFNPAPVPRKELVELTVWDYSGNYDRLEVVDHEGRQVPFQLLDREPVSYWAHRYCRVLIAADVPALGHAVYALREKECTAYPTHLLYAEREEQPLGDVVLENSRIRASFDTGSGMIHSIVDKRTGAEMLAAPAGLYLVRTQNPGMTAWRIGRYLGMEAVTDTQTVTVDKGALRQSVSFKQHVMHSTVDYTVSLDADADHLSLDLRVDWHEVMQNQSFIPVLSFRVPLKAGGEEIVCDVPAGVAARAARQIDVPALTTAWAKASGETLALTSDCKYGYRLADDVLSVTLINTAGDPDPYPERGIHAIKLFLSLTDGQPAVLKNKAETLIRPMVAVPTASHPGSLPARGSMMGFAAEHSVMTALDVAADGTLVLRCFEDAGEADTVVITPPFTVARAELTDLDERPLAAAELADGQVRFALKPHQLAQVKLYQK